MFIGLRGFCKTEELRTTGILQNYYYTGTSLQHSNLHKNNFKTQGDSGLVEPQPQKSLLKQWFIEVLQQGSNTWNTARCVKYHPGPHLLLFALLVAEELHFISQCLQQRGSAHPWEMQFLGAERNEYSALFSFTYEQLTWKLDDNTGTCCQTLTAARTWKYPCLTDIWLFLFFRQVNKNSLSEEGRLMENEHLFLGRMKQKQCRKTCKQSLTMYIGEPHKVAAIILFCRYRANPKSAIKRKRGGSRSDTEVLESLYLRCWFPQFLWVLTAGKAPPLNHKTDTSPWAVTSMCLLHNADTEKRKTKLLKVFRRINSQSFSEISSNFFLYLLACIPKC